MLLLARRHRFPMCGCLVGFVGFLRFSEIAHLRESDVHIFHDHAELFIEASKTDQYRDGSLQNCHCLEA